MSTLDEVTCCNQGFHYHVTGSACITSSVEMGGDRLVILVVRIRLLPVVRIRLPVTDLVLDIGDSREVYCEFPYLSPQLVHSIPIPNSMSLCHPLKIYLTSPLPSVRVSPHTHEQTYRSTLRDCRLRIHNFDSKPGGCSFEAYRTGIYTDAVAERCSRFAAGLELKA